jgi:hypothetical protein
VTDPLIKALRDAPQRKAALQALFAQGPPRPSDDAPRGMADLTPTERAVVAALRTATPGHSAAGEG